MSKQTTLVKDAQVVYYAEGQPYKGPFPAVVEKVHPVDKDKKAEPAKLDLRVFFGGIDGPFHLKTNVPFALEPTKHHWSWLPLDWAWPEPVKAEATAPVEELKGG